MNEVIRAAAELQSCCEAQGWRFCLIGGLDLQRWGEPRETVDVDLILLTFSAEDLIVMKAFANRAKDWVDHDGILIRQGPRLDWNYIRQQLTPLVELKGEPEIALHLESCRVEVGGGPGGES